MGAGILLEMGLEPSEGGDAVQLADAVRASATGVLQGRGLGFESLGVDVAGRRVALHLGARQAAQQLDLDELSMHLEAVLERVCEECVWNERPLGESLRWLVCLRDTDLLSVACRGLLAGRESRGHAERAPEALPIASAQAYPDTLRAAHVVVAVAERQAHLEAALAGAASELDAECMPDPRLLARWVARSEKPEVAVLELGHPSQGWPDGLLEAVCRGTVEGFTARARRGGAGRACLWVADGGTDSEMIRAAEAQLSQRIAEVDGLLAQDRQASPAELSEALTQCIYHPRLGSWADKQRRVLALAGALARPGQEAALARISPWLCTEHALRVTGEFPALAEELGAWLSRIHGLPPELAVALRCGTGDEGPPPSGEVGKLRALLCQADALDTLAGACAAGLRPTGTVDLLEVRAAARKLAHLALEESIDVHVTAQLQAAMTAHEGIREPPDEALRRARALVRRALASELAERFPRDVLEAVLAAWDDTWVGELRQRVSAVARFAVRDDSRSLLLSLKRCYAWTRDARHGQLDPALLAEGAERGLWEASQSAAEGIERGLAATDAERCLEAVVTLAAPLERFFQEVRVGSEPPGRADNRLHLLASVVRMTSRLAHFHLLALEST